MQAPDSAYIARIVAGRESAAEDAEDIEEAAAVIAKRISIKEQPVRLAAHL